MSVNIQVDSFGRSYPQIFEDVMVRGDERPSRIGRMREIIGWSMTCKHADLCVVDRPGYSLEFARTEAMLLLAGRHEPELLARHAPKAAELITEQTAYGPRVYPQLYHAEAELRRDPTSRRAVVHVARDNDLMASHAPVMDKMRAGEMPCTLSWQFLIRDDLLHMIVTMRSSDLVWGMSYDVPSFVTMQTAMAISLGVGLGTYTHQSGSMHVYERHYDLKIKPCEKQWTFPLAGIAVPRSITELKGMASMQVNHDLNAISL